MSPLQFRFSTGSFLHLSTADVRTGNFGLQFMGGSPSLYLEVTSGLWESSLFLLYGGAAALATPFLFGVALRGLELFYQ